MAAFAAVAMASANMLLSLAGCFEAEVSGCSDGDDCFAGEVCQAGQCMPEQAGADVGGEDGGAADAVGADTAVQDTGGGETDSGSGSDDGGDAAGCPETCPERAHAIGRCEGGECVYTCEEGWHDPERSEGEGDAGGMASAPLDCSCPVQTRVLDEGEELSGVMGCGCFYNGIAANRCRGERGSEGKCEAFTQVEPLEPADQEDGEDDDCDGDVDELEFKRLTAGADFNCGLTVDSRDNERFCWGRGKDGQLGRAVRMPSPDPVKGVGFLMAVDAGGRHGCQIAPSSSERIIQCWGADDQGQLGDGSGNSSSKYEAKKVDFSSASIQEVRAMQVAAGWNHTCALLELDGKNTGTAFCWGSDEAHQLGDGGDAESKSSPVAVATMTGFMEIESGREYSCGIGGNGLAYCWGSNAERELGIKSSASTVDEVKEVNAPTTKFETLALSMAETRHTCGVSQDGDVYCWGANDRNQVSPGISDSTVQTPKAVDIRTGVSFVDVAVGDGFSCAVSKAGKAYCWGEGKRGQLGAGDATVNDEPVEVKTDARFEAVEAGLDHACGLATSGEIHCWGANDFLQVARGGDVTKKETPVPVGR